MKNRKETTPEKWSDFGGDCPLVQLFASIIPIPEEMRLIINRETYEVHIKKYKFIISPLDRNKNLFLIVKGVVRGYVKDGSKEITTWINRDNTIVGTIRNLWVQKDSDEYLQALEDTQLICIPHLMSEYLYANYREANFIGRVMIERYYQDAEERAYLCRISSAEKRYKKFLETHAGLLDLISLKYIASYLGIRLETLSRIRTQINK